MVDTVDYNAGEVSFDDPSFEPDRSSSYDPIRRFIMSSELPQKPFEGRKFQLGGVERVALLADAPFMFRAHKFSVQWNGSAVNGYRRCNHRDADKEKGIEAQECAACKHYESAPKKPDDNGRMKVDAKCGPRQQRFGINLLVYKTDLEGNLLDENNQPIQIDVANKTLAGGAPVIDIYQWVFNADKFKKLRTLKKNWGDLRAQDMVFTLVDNKPTSFQDHDIQPVPHSAWRLAGEEYGKQLIERYKKDAYDLNTQLGKAYSNEQLQEFMFGSDGSGGRPRPQAAHAPMADVASEIQAELQNGIMEGTPAAPATPAAPPAPPAPKAADDLTSDFDALLGG